MHRQAAINNSTFKNEQDTGKAVCDWTCNYSKKTWIQSKYNQFTERRYV
ncbi:hypothetical protein [Candidatus Nitrosocosmicus sp. SS]|nr:hypothetical protein [Candidatus Nitrosocosmicus sp. SS]